MPTEAASGSCDEREHRSPGSDGLYVETRGLSRATHHPVPGRFRGRSRDEPGRTPSAAWRIAAGPTIAATSVDAPPSARHWPPSYTTPLPRAPHPRPIRFAGRPRFEGRTAVFKFVISTLLLLTCCAGTTAA